MSHLFLPVMQKRHVKKADADLDYYPTPPWPTSALCSWLESNVGSLGDLRCWEPACGEGHMSRTLSEYFGSVRSTDIKSYGFGETLDFLWPNDGESDWIVTNPPFILGKEFAIAALRKASRGVAILVRSAFLEGKDRFSDLFSGSPPSDILQFVERVGMVKGRLDRDVASATPFSWLVWSKDAQTGTRFHWIPPCRKRLELDSDYPAEGLS